MSGIFETNFHFKTSWCQVRYVQAQSFRFDRAEELPTRRLPQLAPRVHRGPLHVLDPPTDPWNVHEIRGKRLMALGRLRYSRLYKRHCQYRLQLDFGFCNLVLTE